MKKLILLLILIISTLSYAFTKEDLGIGVGISTGGYQLKGIYTFNDFFSSSLEYNNFTLNNFTTGDLTGNLKISALKANAHFHPFAGGFRLTGGYTYNLSDINFKMNNISYDYGGSSPAIMNGTVNTDFGKYLPYIGLGWGYQYGDFLSLDWEIGLQFVKKISGANTFDINATVDSTTANDIVTKIDDGANDLLTTDQETELKALLQSDLFDLQNKLNEYGVTPPSDFTLPDSNTVIGDLENQIDTMVNSTGLGFIQDLLGYAPLPFFSFGFTVFLW